MSSDDSENKSPDSNDASAPNGGTPGGAERRKEPRFNLIRSRIYVSISTSNGEQYSALVYDLSASGMQVFSEKLLAIGEIVLVDVPTPQGHVNVSAAVRWAQAAPLSGRVIKEKPFEAQMGMEFLNLSPEQKSVIAKILEAEGR